MKCYNCKINVDGKFAHAIAQNICPACGKDIMSPEKIASYMSLQQLIAKSFPDQAEKIANLVVANFEIKQLFREDIAEEISEVSEVVEERTPDQEADDAHKKNQIAEARKKIREQEYENALKSQYGMGDTDPDGVMEPDGFFEVAGEETNPIILASKLEQAQRQSDSYENMVSGAGSVKRSG